ncbi:MAG TPA: right-handed parallel beta-helix repeat-containing protein [Capsulimonadaceae bacterium]|jgi:hypothetical protein
MSLHTAFPVTAILVAIALAGPASGSPKAVEVGDTANPGGLSAAIAAAYAVGAHEIVIRRGTYVLPKGDRAGLAVRDMKDTVIKARGVDLAFSSTDQDAVDFTNCENVTFDGPAIHFTHPQTGQAKIIAIGDDPVKGPYYDVQLCAGFPTDATFKSCAIMMGDKPLIRPGSSDFGATSIEPLATTGQARLYLRAVPKGNPWGVVVGDHVVCRGPGHAMFHTGATTRCTFSNLTLYWSGVFAYFETDGCSGNRWLGNKLTYGPIPPGATERALLAQSADGLHSSGSRVGPDIENCLFEGMLDDGIAVHGTLYQVAKCSGTTLTLGCRYPRCDFAAGDPIRLANSETGLIADSTVVSVKPVEFTPPQISKFGAYKGKLTYYEVAIANAIDAPFDSTAADPARCGSGFKIIGCTIRNHRARGILVKADDGVIKGNTVDGSTIAGIVVSPEIYWGEAGYSRNMLIEGNTIRHTNYAMTGHYYPQAGALTITGEGSMGQRGIRVLNNTFEGIDCANIEVRWADGVEIRGNRFLNPFHQPSVTGPVGKSTGVDATAVIWIGDSKNVTLLDNTVRSMGSTGTALVTVAPTASNVTGAGEGQGVRRVR